MQTNKFGTIKSRKAFTLIELSVVLVVIGLIVAAVVAGQNLVSQAKLRNLIKEQENTRQAISAFKLRFSALPGDFSNAYAFWGSSCAAGGAADCNGDGDSQIEISGTDVNDGMEGYRFWQHLNLAGIYPGSYTGIGAGTDADASAPEGTINVNIPASKVTGVGITPIYNSGTTYLTASYSGNILLFGGAVTDEIAAANRFSAPDAYSVDVKADDGAPTSGTMRSKGSSGTDATDCVDSSTSAYNLDSTSATPCGIAFTL